MNLRTSVLYQHNLCGPQQLLRDDDASQGVLGIASCISDNVRVAEVNSIRGGRIDSGVHACYDEVFLC